MGEVWGSNLAPPKGRKNDPSAAPGCYRFLLTEHDHRVRSGFKEDRGAGLPNSWPQRIPGPIVAIEMLKGFFMPVIVASIRQRWRFVNHDLGMVYLSHTRLVASSDSSKQTLHGFYMLLWHLSFSFQE